MYQVEAYKKSVGNEVECSEFMFDDNVITQQLDTIILTQSMFTG